MPYPRRQISKAEGRRISEDYLRDLPGWNRLDIDTLYRKSMPFAHILCFERLSYGVYRPMPFIDVLIDPRDEFAASFCLNYLPYPHQTCSLLAHERKRSEMLEAMKRFVLPSVSSPLDSRQVYQFARREAERTMRDGKRPRKLYSIALVEAWFGDARACESMATAYERAMDAMWKDRTQWPDYARLELQFLQESVLPWVTRGVASQMLLSIATERLRRAGLAETE